jgi:4-hydroxy-tetrahydrodipicolinate reductase
MKIALVGFGKMGHMIKDAAIELGHEVCVTIDSFAPDADVKNSNADDIVRAVKSSGAEGVIEFTHPSAVVQNLKALVPLGLPLVVGTTGWADSEKEIGELCAANGGTLVRSSNFSTGVNVFYKIIEEAVKLMNSYSEYDTAIWEAHHNQKADSPSGTALEIARRVMANNPNKTKMVVDAFHQKPDASELHVSSTRCGAIPGTHTVFFDSPADTIEITHRARGRQGFAIGAVRALVSLDNALKCGKIQKGKIYSLGDLE